VNTFLFAMIFSCLAPFLTHSTLFKHLGCFSSYYQYKYNKKATNNSGFFVEYKIVKKSE
jgi:hypothetical protein